MAARPVWLRGRPMRPSTAPMLVSFGQHFGTKMRAYWSLEGKMEHCAPGTVRRWTLPMRRWKTTEGLVDVVW
jgi:hypothetical protein